MPRGLGLGGRELGRGSGSGRARGLAIRRSELCTKAVTVRPRSVFDLMEPERPAADRKVLEFIKGHVFDPADFVYSIGWRMSS